MTDTPIVNLEREYLANEPDAKEQAMIRHLWWIRQTLPQRKWQLRNDICKALYATKETV